MTSSEKAYVIPGEILDKSLLSSSSLKLGPGLRHLSPGSLTPTVPGQLISDERKGLVWVDNDPGRYIPAVGDLVIATIHHAAMDFSYASITDYAANATLSNLAFEGATKKIRPQISQGSLVYARVALANKHMDPELECVSSSTGKADGLGPLFGGMMFSVSLGMTRRLSLGDAPTQSDLGILRDFSNAGLTFELAVGRNGKIWVDSKNIRITLAVGRAIQETDEKKLNMGQQTQLVQKLIRELGL